MLMSNLTYFIKNIKRHFAYVYVYVYVCSILIE